MVEPPVEAVRSLAEHLHVSLGSMGLSLEPSDFDIVSHAVRNLLLAPPYDPEDKAAGKEEEEANRNKEFHVVSPHSQQFAAAAAAAAANTWGGGGTFDGSGGGTGGGAAQTKDHRYSLKVVVEDELEKLRAKQAELQRWDKCASLTPLHQNSCCALFLSSSPDRPLRVVEYSIGSGIWRLKPSSEEASVGAHLNSVMCCSFAQLSSVLGLPWNHGSSRKHCDQPSYRASLQTHPAGTWTWWNFRSAG